MQTILKLQAFGDNALKEIPARNGAPAVKVTEPEENPSKPTNDLYQPILPSSLSLKDIHKVERDRTNGSNVSIKESVAQVEEEIKESVQAMSKSGVCRILWDLVLPLDLFKLIEGMITSDIRGLPHEEVGTILS